MHKRCLLKLLHTPTHYIVLLTAILQPGQIIVVCHVSRKLAERDLSNLMDSLRRAVKRSFVRQDVLVESSQYYFDLSVSPILVNCILSQKENWICIMFKIFHPNIHIHIHTHIHYCLKVLSHLEMYLLWKLIFFVHQNNITLIRNTV